MKSQPALVLASTSSYRRELLGRLRIAFTALPPLVDESRLAKETPFELVRRLARAKAGAIGAQRPEDWIIGADQIAVLHGARILGKPASAAACIDQLQEQSGQTVSFLTAVAVARHTDAALIEFTDTTRVKFRQLDRATLERYVRLESPLDCAGGFKSEGLGIALCESIDGDDPSALIGLPLIRLAAVLRSVGYEVP